ncbi:hypothetical protein [Salinicola peritrichatus]|uniref:hypothetical protein n=1 Tax=Salinicola peritrichatus TaxID=1267424 RepID=UPI000DA154F5|nr:hypothetical protein [Salinicola peritrichatus]
MLSSHVGYPLLRAHGTPSGPDGAFVHGESAWSPVFGTTIGTTIKKRIALAMRLRFTDFLTMPTIVFHIAGVSARTTRET